MHKFVPTFVLFQTLNTTQTVLATWAERCTFYISIHEIDAYICIILKFDQYIVYALTGTQALQRGQMGIGFTRINYKRRSES